MKLIAILGHTEESNNLYADTYNKLIAKLDERSLLTENKYLKSPYEYCKKDTYKYSTSYGRAGHTGELIDELADLNELEISMLMDRGYSHFGGSSSKNGNNFTVEIYTD